jgi:hypothetical protein
MSPSQSEGVDHRKEIPVQWNPSIVSGQKGEQLRALIAILALSIAVLAFTISVASQKAFGGALSPFGKFSLVLALAGVGTAAADVVAA